jgi:hypothetical protein
MQLTDRPPEQFGSRNQPGRLRIALEMPAKGLEVSENADRVPCVRPDQDPLELLEVGVLAENVHSRDPSTLDMSNQPTGCRPRFSSRETERSLASRTVSILAPHLFPSAVSVPEPQLPLN